ncbi:MAG: formyl transferase [Planctomycetota bacterium]|nr:MAG: formyl transferase [Planctomycetota bacterium]
MRTVLICQSDALLVRDVMPRWLASFSELAGILIIDEPPGYRLQKLRKTISKQGILPTLDLLAYRLYQKLFLTHANRQYEAQVRAESFARYPTAPTVPILTVSSPNSVEAQEFLWSVQPDISLACCKHLLRPNIFEIPTHGTFVMHPGICPEYRNAHGCFWALVNGDMERVGMTLLRIDHGIDTGPVYGHFRAPFNEQTETSLIIQRRMTYHNLHQVSETLRNIVAGTAVAVNTTGRKSAIWGQPTLTTYWKWRRAARHRKTTPPVTPQTVSAAVSKAVPINSMD